mmetsp:Transcript_87473/g.168446  ORF Transcript_87473/g.168446 Transcript_87473/m.168446 type:complete len:217 (+) Transcript_87473:94-744(+)
MLGASRFARKTPHLLLSCLFLVAWRGLAPAWQCRQSQPAGSRSVGCACNRQHPELPPRACTNGRQHDASASTAGVGRIGGVTSKKSAPAYHGIGWPVSSPLGAALAAFLLVGPTATFSKWWAEQGGVYFYASRTAEISGTQQGQYVDTKWWSVVTNIPDKYLEEKSGQGPWLPPEKPTLFSIDFQWDFSQFVDGVVDSPFFDAILDSKMLDFMLKQ